VTAPRRPRCLCARRCCRSCATPCLAARRRVPAGAGALVAQAGLCCRGAPSARCGAATASSTRPARAGMRAARTGVRSASSTTRGRPARPGLRSPPPARTCASARSAGASRPCGPLGLARPRVAWAPPPRPPVRPGPGLAPPDPASWPNTTDHGWGRVGARTDRRDEAHPRPRVPLLPQQGGGQDLGLGAPDSAILPSVLGEVRDPAGSRPAPPSGLTTGCRDARTLPPAAGERSAGTEDSGRGLKGQFPKAESGPRRGPHSGTAQAPQDLTRPSTLQEVGRASGQMGVPWCSSALLFFFGGETSEFL
jgi:hypothetical protein